MREMARIKIERCQMYNVYWQKSGNRARVHDNSDGTNHFDNTYTCWFDRKQSVGSHHLFQFIKIQEPFLVRVFVEALTLDCRIGSEKNSTNCFQVKQERNF